MSGILPPTGSLLVIPNIPPLETRIMVRRTLHGLSGRLLGSALLAGLLALLPVPAWDGPHPMLPVGAIRSSAQGGMDVGILTPSFSNLPLSVQPGETFVVGVSTAPGARCSGQVTFRDHPPIDLEQVAAPGAACTWSVTVPPTVRPSTATIVVPITRSGQWWTLHGVVYVRPVGESR
jgi:hypothetical protein